MRDDPIEALRRALQWTVNPWTDSWSVKLGDNRYWWHARAGKHGKVMVSRSGRGPRRLGYHTRLDRVEEAIVLDYLGPRR